MPAAPEVPGSVRGLDRYLVGAGRHGVAGALGAAVARDVSGAAARRAHDAVRHVRLVRALRADTVIMLLGQKSAYGSVVMSLRVDIYYKKFHLIVFS